MNATELRIGNLVNHSIYGNCETTSLDYEMICIQRTEIDIKNWFVIEDYQPIPLTDEILIEFNFTKKYENTFSIERFMVYRLDGVFYFSIPNFSIEIKSVHQLQNLYYALTCKELTLRN
jgi:prolipoprotein diacylglyceryltransferase